MQETNAKPAPTAAAGPSPGSAGVEDEAGVTTVPTSAVAGNPPRRPRDTVSIHVKGVPKAIWLRARENAIASELAFKHYLLKVFEQCQPFPPAHASDGRA
jgi:hypothetical protein